MKNQSVTLPWPGGQGFALSIPRDMRGEVLAALRSGEFFFWSGDGAWGNNSPRTMLLVREDGRFGGIVPPAVPVDPVPPELGLTSREWDRLVRATQSCEEGSVHQHLDEGDLVGALKMVAFLAEKYGLVTPCMGFSCAARDLHAATPDRGCERCRESRARARETREEFHAAQNRAGIR